MLQCPQMTDEMLLYGNDNILLFFDDDGEDLTIGDRVLVNHEVEAMIGEIGGVRRLVGFPHDEIVHSIELITEPDPLLGEWPDAFDDQKS
jgi:hypothetical protein